MSSAPSAAGRADLLMSAWAVLTRFFFPSADLLDFFSLFSDGVEFNDDDEEFRLALSSTLQLVPSTSLPEDSSQFSVRFDMLLLSTVGVTAAGAAAGCGG
jgi:hypothetical protein